VNPAAGPSLVALQIEPALRGIVRVGTLVAEPVSVAPAGAALEGEIAATARELRERFAGRAPAEIEELAAARELYRAFGIDPTKTRPSSEKLLRRVLADRPLSRISNAVDLGNLLALRLLLPIGLYDLERIEGNVTLRSGRPGECYEGIAGRPIGLERRPLLADTRGPFGNPTADSRRTAVGARTRSLWLTVFAPASVPGAALAQRMREAAGELTRHLGGPASPVRTATGVVESQ